MKVLTVITNLIKTVLFRMKISLCKMTKINKQSQKQYMSKLTLNRFYTNEHTTLGCLSCTELDIAIFTCELPWNNNEQYISCIPSGTYKLVPWTSPKFGKCLKVLDVEGRTNILIHKGNSSQDTTGCILPALICKSNGIVQNSKGAFDILIGLVIDEWILEIVSSS